MTRKGRTPKSKWFARLALAVPFMPLIGNSFGWIFTEMGRQPWVVFGLLETKSGVSPTSSVGLVGTSLVVFTLLYGILAVVEFDLIRRAVILGPPEEVPGSIPRRRGNRRSQTLDYLLVHLTKEKGRRHGSGYRLVHPDRRPVVGLLRPRRIDFGVGMLLPVVARMKPNDVRF